MHYLIRSDSAPTLSKAEVCSLVQTKTSTDTIVPSVSSTIGFIVSRAEIVGTMVERAVHEYSLRDTKEARTGVADSEPSMKCLPTRPTKPYKISAEPESHEEPLKICRCHHVSPRRIGRKNRYLRVSICYTTTSSTALPGKEQLQLLFDQHTPPR